MVSKKLLGAAIAAACLSAPTFAAINLTEIGGVKPADSSVTIAKETVTAITDGLVVVTNAGSALDVRTAIGSGVSIDNQIYVRFDLANATFDAPAVLTVAGATATVQNGGAEGDAFVVFQVTADGAAIVQSEVLTLAASALNVSATAPVTVRYAAYDTPSAATNEIADNRLASASLANAISVNSGLSVEFEATDVTATVASDFKYFSAALQTASLGSVELAIEADALSATSGLKVANLGELFTDASTLTVVGDLSFADWENTGITVDGIEINEETGVVAVSALTGVDLTADTTASLEVVVNVDGETTINAGDYSVAVDFTNISNAKIGATDVTGEIGSIKQDGTTIQVPYLTTFADYNQRLVLVNRSSKAAPYTISFTEEEGVTATPGAAATGTLAPNETKIIKVTDIVGLAGSTRTAATVIVTAAPGNIDAAATMVNLSDKSTDTVNLH